MNKKYTILSLFTLVLVLAVAFALVSVKANYGFQDQLSKDTAQVLGKEIADKLNLDKELGGGVHNTREIFSDGIELDNGVKVDDYIFDTDTQEFADSTTTLCALYNGDVDSKDRWVTLPFAAITGAPTTTVTYTFATSTTPYKTNASTAVISMKVSTSTETAVGIASHATNTGIAVGHFKWTNGTYLLFNASAESTTYEKALTDPATNTLDGRCAVQYIKE